MGIDLRPVHLGDEDSIRWLRALIWPEHIERQERLGVAIEVAKKDPPRVIEGDASERLAEVLRAAGIDFEVEIDPVRARERE